MDAAQARPRVADLAADGRRASPPTGVTAVVAVLTAIAVIGSLGVVGGVVSDLSRPRGTASEYQFLATDDGKPVDGIRAIRSTTSPT